MSTFAISLFGRFCFRFNGQVLDNLDSTKSQELFCYLLFYRNRPHPRETLASLLWGDNTTAQAKKYLRQALWQIQTALEVHAGISDGQLFLVEPDWIQFKPETDLWLDVAVFEQAFNLVQDMPGQSLDIPSMQALQGALQLYRGDLLEGCYQDWCLYERERLQNMYLAILDKSMAYHEAHLEYEAGLHDGMRILRHDRARERTHRWMMRLYFLAGDRTAALRQYRRCQAALKEELGVQPSRRTVAVHDQIQADQLPETVTPAPVLPAASPSSVAPPFPQVVARLVQLHTFLGDFQRQLRQEIQNLEQTLNPRR